METIFGNSGIGGSRQVAATYLGDGDQQEYHAKLVSMIDDAVDYERSYLQGVREEAAGYYAGELPALPGTGEGIDEDEQPNKSRFVSTDVRDTILTILPSLIRIFCASDEKIANFVPTSEAQQEMADQAYEYVNHVFYEENEGFLILHSLFKDALTVKAGIARWWTDTDHEVKEQTFRNVTQEQYQLLLSEMDGQVEVVDLEDGEDGLIAELTLRYVEQKPLVKIIAVPPEEFRISRYAKTVQTSRLVGHEYDKPASELVAMGLDVEFIKDHLGPSNYYSEERFLRNPALTDSYRGNEDTCLYGEWFVRIDGDGDGVDELRHICTIGNDYAIVSDEVVPYHNFAVFSPDPTPHTAIGDSVADLVMDIQRIKSFMARGMIDNLAESTNPKMVVNELITNIEDALNDDVGAIIRTRGDPNTAVAFSKVPYIGGDLQTNIDYLDNVRASRTGITEASKGLDPKAMQSTALTGIDAIVSGAQERIELIARILAETGLKDLLKGILREVVNNPNPERTMLLRGKWVPVNPSLYDPNMRVTVNPTLGKGSDMIRLQALNEVQQTQMTIIEKYGVKNNPLVGPVEFRNTLEDKLKIVNIKNVSRYFKPIEQATVDAINQSPDTPDPAQLLAQAELEKVKAGTVKTISEKDDQQKQLEFDREKLYVDDNFRRDKLNVDSTIAASDAIAKDGADIQANSGLLSMNNAGD